MFTFTRLHAHLFRQTKSDDVGSHIKSINCMTVNAHIDRQGHIFTSDRPSTRSPSNCPNDSCSGDMNCQAMNPNYSLFCSMGLMTCQRQSLLGASCDLRTPPPRRYLYWGNMHGCGREFALLQRRRLSCRSLNVVLIVP